MIFKIFNVFFRICLTFLACLIWFRYFVNNLTFALIYTAILTFVIELTIHFFLERKNSKNKLKKEEEKLVEKISYNFIYNPEFALDYFDKLCNINYLSEKKKDFLVLTRKNEVDGEKTILFPSFSFNSFSSQNLIDVLRKTEKFNASKIVVCCNQVSNDAISLAKKQEKKIVLLDSKGTYLKLAKPHNFFPENLKEFDFSVKPKFKDLLKNSISRKRAKSYLFSSLILLFSSFVIRMNIYYLVFASVLLVLSIICFFYQPKDLKYENNVL